MRPATRTVILAVGLASSLTATGILAGRVLAGTQRRRGASTVYGSDVYATAAVQCRGTTRDGERCRNRTTDRSGLCYRHRAKSP